MMAAFDLPPPGASSDDVLAALKALHDCVERRFQDVEAQIRQNNRASNRRHMQATNRLKLLEGVIGVMTDPEKGLSAQIKIIGDLVTNTAKRVGAPLEPGAEAAPGLMAMPWPSAAWRLAAALGPLVIVLKVLDSGWPYIVAWARAAYVALIR